MICPKCKSDKVIVNLRSAGTSSKSNRYRTGVKDSWFVPSGQTRRKSKRNYKSIAVCQNCGHTWEIAKPMSFSDYLIWAVILVAIVALLVHKCSPSPTEAGDTGSSQTAEDSIWASDITPLSDFDFYVDKGEIHLKEYTGKRKKVFIASSYEYNGKVLPVVSLEEGRFFGLCDSIIISEGITEIEHAAFNGSNVKYLYFPSTVSTFSGFSYIHDGEILYYGGTESMWEELYPFERSEIDFTEIVCNASVKDLPAK